MAKEPIAANVGLDVSSEQARAFLEALRTDDFRQRFEDPEQAAEALREFGITIAPEAVPKLPAIDQIDEAFQSRWPSSEVRGETRTSCLLWALVAYCAAGEGYEYGSGEASA
jgi:hypothetical protein